MIPVLFFVFSSVAIAAALLMVLHRNPIYSALFLIMTLFALAGLYTLLNAPFIAAVHVIVYTGAIMVLFLFVLMLLDLRVETRADKTFKPAQIVGFVLSLVLVVEFGLFVTLDKPSPVSAGVQGMAQVGDTVSIGTLLFTKYLFPFEIASVLLLSAIIGSVILAKLKLK